MSQRSNILIVTIIGIIFSCDAFTLKKQKLNCDFLDSVNITDGQLNPDKTITFNGVIFSPEQYAKIDYIVINGRTREFAKEHIRGCICNIKPCIRLCCPHGQVVDLSITDGRKCRPHDAVKRFKSIIENVDSARESIQMDEYFGFVDDRPCHELYESEEFLIKHVSLC